MERPLLLRSEVAVAADTSDHAAEMVASPESSVMGSVSTSPHHRPLRSRARGAYRRDVEEGVDESAFYISSHTRRSLEIQEGWKKVRDGKRKRRREEVEDTEVDEPASGSKDEDRGGGAGGEGPRGGAGLAV